MKTLAPLLAAAPLALLMAGTAAAQAPVSGYNLPNINYDMWCQQTMHYPPSRCDQRLPKDNADFEKFLQIYDKYEMRRLENQRSNQERDQAIMHNDSLDEPGAPNQPAPGSAGTIPDPH